MTEKIVFDIESFGKNEWLSQDGIHPSPKIMKGQNVGKSSYMPLNWSLWPYKRHEMRSAEEKLSEFYSEYPELRFILLSFFYRIQSFYPDKFENPIVKVGLKFPEIGSKLIIKDELKATLTICKEFPSIPYSQYDPKDGESMEYVMNYADLELSDE